MGKEVQFMFSELLKCHLIIGNLLQFVQMCFVIQIFTYLFHCHLKIRFKDTKIMIYSFKKKINMNVFLCVNLMKYNVLLPL